jgi:RimJ/RimL family protein N-acetyltransferase
MTPSPNRIHILTERLALCRPNEDDLRAIYEIHADPETNLHNPKGPMQNESEAVDVLAHWRAEWDDKDWGYWSIALRSDPERVIGFGGISTRPRFGGNSLLQKLMAENAANLYFRFRPEAWGCGYANEMAQQALQLAFGTAGVQRVVGITRESNTLSRKALQRIGLGFHEHSDDVPGQEPSLVYVIDAASFSAHAAATQC